MVTGTFSPDVSATKMVAGTIQSTQKTTTMNDKKTVIQAHNLSRKFGDFVAVNAITFEVKAGEIFGFLGANGAGKTTAMKILCGLLAPTSGEAKVAGFDVYTQSEQIKTQIGYMSQKFSLYENLTVKENIQFFGGIYGIPRKELAEKSKELIDRLGLAHEANKLVGSLPLGWKQKISFSTAILHTPQIVFLDEPTGGVDPITRRQFWDMIYEAAASGITIFVTTHYMDEAEYCDRVSMMVDGKIAALDTPTLLKKQFQTDSMEGVFLQLARGAKRTDG
jgi:ABC-2 type transport system ATP-binding protein